MADITTDRRSIHRHRVPDRCLLLRPQAPLRLLHPTFRGSEPDGAAYRFTALTFMNSGTRFQRLYRGGGESGVGSRMSSIRSRGWTKA